MRIADAAREIGVPEHVLRHWDAVGTVSPDRTPAGHRDYSSEDLHRLHVLRACQDVGMSLGEIRLVLDKDEAGRSEVIGRQRELLRARRERLEDAERFLAHVVDCRHDLLTRCPDCSRYAEAEARRGPAPRPLP
jgi:MerR family transcriptional regulator, copper efflux regulator